MNKTIPLEEVIGWISKMATKDDLSSIYFQLLQEKSIQIILWHLSYLSWLMLLIRVFCDIGLEWYYIML